MNKLIIRVILSFIIIIGLVIIGFKQVIVASNTVLLATVVAMPTPVVLDLDLARPTATMVLIKPLVMPTSTVSPTASPTPTPKPLVVEQLDFKPGELTGAQGLLTLLQSTATPPPHIVPVPPNAPDPTTVTDHFWFARPFIEPYTAWGSFNYPYGTNAHGEYLWHFGIDILKEPHETIYAVKDGVIAFAGTDDILRLGEWKDFYGQAVVIKHDELWNGQPVYSLYGHVSKTLAEVGQHVKTGDPIAEVGQSGIAMGYHLHFEVRVGGNTYDHTRNPDLWVRSDPGYGVIAGRVVDKQGYFVPIQLVTLHRPSQSPSFWRETYTYPNNIVNYDDQYLENFTFSDVAIGEYQLKTSFGGQELVVPVTVKEYQTSFVLLLQP